MKTGKLIILLFSVGVSLFVLSIFVGTFSFYLGIVSSVAGLLGLIYSISQEKRQEKRDLTLLKGQDKIIEIQNEMSHDIKEVMEIIQSEFNSKRILERIRVSLKGMISTEELVEEFDNPLNALIIYKWGEPPRRKLIRDKLTELGFKDLGAGLKILPPTRMPHPPLKTREDVERWLKENVLNSLPKDYKYSIALAQIVDLRKAYAVKYAPKEWFDRFRGRTIFDILTWEELFPVEFIQKFLRKKTHVSVEELVVKHFPFSFLISRFVKNKNLDRILSQREKVIEELKMCLDLKR